MQNAEFFKWKIENGKLKIMDNIVEEKSFRFAVRIVHLHKHLCSVKKEYILSKQLLRSGTSIGANIAEAQQAQSKSDFAHKMSIALKEASETDYWIRLLHATEYLSDKEKDSILLGCEELIKMLTAIVKSSKK